jgi:hypothetical protein
LSAFVWWAIADAAGKDRGRLELNEIARLASRWPGWLSAQRNSIFAFVAALPTSVSPARNAATSGASDCADRLLMYPING